MIISEEQARLAADYLRTTRRACGATPVEDVPTEVLAKAIEIASHAPDVREERLEEARSRLQHDVTADDIASKMLSRIVSDALR